MLRCFVEVMKRADQKYEFEEKNKHRKVILLIEGIKDLIGKTHFHKR